MFEVSDQRWKRLSKERKNNFRKSQKINNIEERSYHDLRRMNQMCIHCNAKFWINEKDHNSN